MAMFDFESIYVQVKKICDTDITTRIGKNVEFSLYISSKLNQKRISFGHPNLGVLVD